MPADLNLLFFIYIAYSAEFQSYNTSYKGGTS
ncbi:hypothetical protein BSNT_09323 [Bacillus subtilis subsp. natto BEST195]|nr:hypothetical protein BSNT_09323 [Bacillus subtilis subsp. natto BEST195]